MSKHGPELAALLKEAREARGYDKKYIAKMTGISLRQVHRIEAGESEPSWNTMDKWLQVCGFSVNWSLERKW